MIQLTDIAPEFIFILERGLVPEPGEYAPKTFGNALLVLAGSSFSMRFERDRGQVFVDVGNQVVGWHKLEYVLEFVDPAITQEELGEPPDVVALARLMASRWHSVEAVFHDRRLATELQEFVKRKSAAWLDHVFRKR